MRGLSAKQLKTPDEFFKSMVVFLRYVKGNAKLILSLGLAAIFITAVFVSFGYLEDKRNEESWNLLFDAETKVKNAESASKNNDEAIKIFKDVLTKIKTDSSKNYVMLKIADRYYAKNEWDSAIDFYGKVINKDSGILKQMALLGMASSKEMKGDVKAAVDFFARLSANEDSLYRPLAMLGLARCYAKSGNKAKAQESYDNIIIAFPETDYARIASTAKSGI